MTNLSQILNPEYIDNTPYRFIKPASLEKHTFAKEVAVNAAKKIRSVYLDGQRQANLPRDPVSFAEECFNTAAVYFDVRDAIKDDHIASLGLAILEEAGWFKEHLKPTPLRTQAELVMLTVDAAFNLKNFLPKQAALV